MRAHSVRVFGSEEIADKCPSGSSATFESEFVVGVLWPCSQIGLTLWKDTLWSPIVRISPLYYLLLGGRYLFSVTINIAASRTLYNTVGTARSSKTWHRTVAFKEVFFSSGKAQHLCSSPAHKQRWNKGEDREISTQSLIDMAPSLEIPVGWNPLCWWGLKFFSPLRKFYLYRICVQQYWRAWSGDSDNVIGLAQSNYHTQTVYWGSNKAPDVYMYPFWLLSSVITFGHPLEPGLSLTTTCLRSRNMS